MRKNREKSLKLYYVYYILEMILLLVCVILSTIEILFLFVVAGCLISLYIILKEMMKYRRYYEEAQDILIKRIKRKGKRLRNRLGGEELW